MAIDPKKVLVGAPDQSPTTGAVNYADTSATRPTSAVSTLTGFTPCGYVSEDGLTLSTDYGTTTIKDWSKSTVRTLLDEFSGTVSFSFIQRDKRVVFKRCGYSQGFGRRISSDTQAELDSDVQGGVRPCPGPLLPEAVAGASVS